MIDRIFVKIVFYNNFYTSRVDIFSTPVISTILTALNFNQQHYVTYERGSDNPDSLRRTFRQSKLQYELLEFAYHCRRAQDEGSPTTSNTRRKRKCNEYKTYSDRNLLCASFEKFKIFQKEISWCIIKNAQCLSQYSSENNRFCYVNSMNEMNMVGTSPTNLETQMDLESYDDGYDGDEEDEHRTINDECYGKNYVLGYMKVFSNSAKESYIHSLNYKNKHNLHKHIIIYFDVTRYYQRYSAHIFRITFQRQEQVIDLSLSSITKNDKEDDERLKEIEGLLCDEIVSSEQSMYQNVEI
ncbi:hypothetical protein [Drosophila suzukii associated hytrosavirus 1]|nr:hypothetical protein [Drosophila suzukii associated hytrosavirus 1]